jgi:putative DNA primase/helicase
MYGKTFVPGGLNEASKEMYLKITGRNQITVGRIYKKAWHGVSRIKLVWVSNEPPYIDDAEDALQSRFVKLWFEQSFFGGNENINLLTELEAELPAIAVRCLAAYRRLCKRGRFVQPASGLRVEREMQKERDPFKAMIQECFEPAPQTEHVTKADTRTVAKAWFRENGKEDLADVLKDNALGNKIRALEDFKGITEYRPNGKGPRTWRGVRLSAEGARLLSLVPTADEVLEEV